ncbi:MAG: hypothetical protein ABSG59_14165 [Verrucomicrobiota bacterium]
MRMPLINVTAVVLGAAGALLGQAAFSHPHQDQYSNSTHSANQPAPPPATDPKIDPGLAASKIKLVGTINGIKGTIGVTNLSSKTITPVVKVVLYDQKGAKLGAISKTGFALESGADEMIEILATNIDAADLKLLKVTREIPK